MNNSQEERIYENLPCTNDSQLGLEEIISMNDKYMIRESQLGLEEIVSSNDQYMIRESQLELEEMIGQGQFTTVHKGFCTLREEGRVSVVVKKFRNGNVVEEDEFLEEAETMRNLSHQRIVHVIGICRANRIMIVLEFCPCGPLNSYLANHKKLKQSTVLQLMWQVAQGMSYISYKNYIHGQLSARNVFLLSETSAKIGGFKLLNLNREDIYKDPAEFKGQVKWNPPETILKSKFSIKSDVWSYGITLWEATSYGDTPYRKVRYNEVSEFLEDGKRLSKPVLCDEQVYEIMLECWQYKPQDRPTFDEIEEKIKYQHHRLLSFNK